DWLRPYLGAEGAALSHPAAPAAPDGIPPAPPFQEAPAFPQNQPALPPERPGFPQDQPAFPQPPPAFPQEEPGFPQERPAFPPTPGFPAQTAFPPGPAFQDPSAFQPVVPEPLPSRLLEQDFGLAPGRGLAPLFTPEHAEAPAAPATEGPRRPAHPDPPPLRRDWPGSAVTPAGVPDPTPGPAPDPAPPIGVPTWDDLGGLPESPGDNAGDGRAERRRGDGLWASRGARPAGQDRAGPAGLPGIAAWSGGGAGVMESQPRGRLVFWYVLALAIVLGAWLVWRGGMLDFDTVGAQTAWITQSAWPAQPDVLGWGG
ncbi:MAG: hypothetical protein LBT54_03480, partial [Bifidobacteriaceae bacterium]|nr:hypothetical protein [Bifidobacteriaceae bacterium]